MDIKTGDVLGCGTLVVDDRGVGEELKAEFNCELTGFLGGFMIKQEIQGCGLGTYFWRLIDAEMQAEVNRTNKAQIWGLGTSNTHAVKIFVGTNYKLLKKRHFRKDFGGIYEDFYLKTYEPQTR